MTLPAAAALFDAHLAVAGKAASVVLRRLPARAAHLRDDLRNVALAGLWEAALRYDPARGVPFAAFAAGRCRGACLDLLRSERCRVGSGCVNRGGRKMPFSLPLLDAKGRPRQLADRLQDDALRAVDTRDEAEACLRRLPASMRRTVRVVYLEAGGCQQKAGRLLGVGASVVCRRLQAAREEYRRVVIRG